MTTRDVPCAWCGWPVARVVVKGAAALYSGSALADVLAGYGVTILHPACAAEYARDRSDLNIT